MVRDSSVREHARQVLLDGLADAGLEVTEVGEDRWMTMLSGDWKRTIPVLFHLEDRSLGLTSLFSGVPDEGHAEVYRILLHRNQRSGPVHFALDDEGDLILTGELPLEALDARRLDEVLGSVLTLADETFNQVLRTGFATYLEAEQRWRAGVGMAPNPVGDAAATPATPAAATPATPAAATPTTPPADPATRPGGSDGPGQ